MADKLLYRQIHPNFVHDGIVTSQAFKPTKSNKQLSVYDGSMIDAKPAWEHYRRLGLKSTGVMAVTRIECKSEDLGVISDPAPYKEHAVIVFDGLTPKAIKDAAKSLAAYANKRGWCYHQTISD